MSHWYRDLVTDPGHLGAWASRLLEAEPQTPANTVAEAVWPWPDELPESYADQCRTLRTALMALHPAPQIVLLAAPGPESGVSTLARRLSEVCASMPGKSCLLLPVAARWEETIFRDPDRPNLHWMDAATSIGPVADSLAGPEWEWTCAQARLQFDVVIIDGLPASSGAAFDLLVRACDAVVLLVRAGWSTHPSLSDALRRIPSERLAGIVLNG